MESIVDDILTGRCCELCGQNFKEPSSIGPEFPPFVYEHGRPVVCHPCWDGLKEGERKYYHRATAETFGQAV
jgi:hypothetical protein